MNTSVVKFCWRLGVKLDPRSAESWRLLPAGVYQHKTSTIPPTRIGITDGDIAYLDIGAQDAAGPYRLENLDIKLDPAMPQTARWHVLESEEQEDGTWMVECERNLDQKHRIFTLREKPLKKTYTWDELDGLSTTRLKGRYPRTKSARSERDALADDIERRSGLRLL